MSQIFLFAPLVGIRKQKKMTCGLSCARASPTHRPTTLLAVGIDGERAHDGILGRTQFHARPTDLH